MEKERISSLVDAFIENTLNNFEYKEAESLTRQFKEMKSFLEKLELNEYSKDAIYELLNEKDISLKKEQILNLILDFDINK